MQFSYACLSFLLICSSFSVSHVTPGDMVGVANLLSGLEGAEDIVSDVTQYTLAKRDPNNDGGTPISAIVAKCFDQVVGVAVLRTEQVQESPIVTPSVQVIKINLMLMFLSGTWLYPVPLQHRGFCILQPLPSH